MNDFINNKYLILSNEKIALEELLKQQSDDFKAVYKEEMNWSNDYKQNNLERLFYNDVNFQANLNGTTRIHLVIVESLDDRFIYDLNENSYINPRARKINESNEDIYITSSKLDFLHKVSLLFGVTNLSHIYNQDKYLKDYNVDYRDLIGCNGWSSFTELFEFLNFTTKWVVFRNSEFLPNNFWGNDKDVDCLCQDLASYKALSNAIKRSNGVSSFCIRIENRIVDFDIRFLGDGYYDYFWEKDMLETFIYENDVVPVLSSKNYFYSLIYHGYLHKKVTIKKIYLERIKEISVSYFHGFDIDKYEDEKYLLLLLQNFLKRNNYTVSKPIDRSVWINLNERLIKKINLKDKKQTLKKKVILLIFKYRISKIKHILPGFISIRVLNLIKRNI